MKNFISCGSIGHNIRVIEQGDCYTDAHGQKVKHSRPDPLIEFYRNDGEDLICRYRWNTLENFPLVAHRRFHNLTIISAELEGEMGHDLNTQLLTEMVSVCKIVLPSSTDEATEGRRWQRDTPEEQLDNNAQPEHAAQTQVSINP